MISKPIELVRSLFHSLRTVIELAALFLKLGTISFGGYAAHIAMMEHEVIQRRGWLSRQHFLDMVGATNLIPGPNAVEMAGHIGYRRAGLFGSIVSGVCFSLPAILITGVCAWAYVQYASLPTIEPFLPGIKPVVLALIAVAAWRLGKKALAGWQLVLICLGAVVAVLLGSDEVIVLLVSGVVGTLLLRFTGRKTGSAGTGNGKEHREKSAGMVGAIGMAGAANSAGAATLPGGGAAASGPATSTTVTTVGTVAAAATAATTVPLWKLGLFFLKVGAVMFGGGYVLVAYIEGGLVGTYGLSQQQLMDAVAMGQLTPGPMLTTATFVGYLLAGVPGAVVATVGILLPSFFFVAATNPLIPRLRKSRWVSLFLDAVVAASIGLIIAVAITLAATIMVDWRGWLIALPAGATVLRWKVSPVWLVIAGAVAGWLLW